MDPHTTGPWRCVRHEDEWRVVAGETVGEVVAVCGEQCCHDGVIAANTRLMARAPSMLSLLEWVRDEIKWGHDMTASLALIEAELDHIPWSGPATDRQIEDADQERERAQWIADCSQ